MMLGLGIIVIAILVVAAIVLFVSIEGRDRAVPASAHGHIDQPENGAAVPRKIECRGTIEPELVRSRLVFRLAVEVDGLIRPKEAPVTPDETGHWEQTIAEDGSPDAFAISLWAVNPYGEKQIRDWLERCKLSNDFPGTAEIPGAQRVAKVSGLRLVD